MSCELAEALVKGVDFNVDLLNGRIMFLSTGALGPTIDDFFDSGGCAVQVDIACANAPVCAPAPCPPCTDDPILNISAEDADSDRFVFNIDVAGDVRLNEMFNQLGCFGWCYSEISQADADLCAIMQQVQCANDAIRQPVDGPAGPGFPIPGGQVPPLFFNTVQTCQFTCPDGTTFGWTFPPNQVAARTLLEANRIAQSLACQYARLRRICIVSTPDPACLGEAYSGRIEASGGKPFTTSQGQCPYLWQMVSGSLPTGLSLNQCTGQVTGTPTASGTFTFTIRATDSIGSYQTKTVTMDVEEITTASALPNAGVGCDYDEQLFAIPSASANELWSVASGALPDGLALGSDGRITGTPTMDASGQGFAFRARVDFTIGDKSGSCQKDFTIDVTSVTDLGTVTPDITAAISAFFDGGNPQPPGRYRIEYVTGAMQYAACVPDPCWSVNTIGAGFKYRYFAGPVEALFPASTAVFLTQAEAETENTGLFVEFDTTALAAISMFLSDTNYGDNIAGAPNPTFRLFLLCPA